MKTLSFKIRKIKADFLGGKQRKINKLNKGVSLGRKVRNDFTKYSVQKMRFQLKKDEKK